MESDVSLRERTQFQPGLALGNGWMLFALAHIPLALLMRQYPILSTAHALLVGVIGVMIVLGGRNSPRAAYVLAYIAGAEVLWRMTEAGVFWEYGKYVSVAVAGLAILTRQPMPRPGRALWFFVLLLPSVAITLTSLSLEQTRDEVSFYLSGALTLAACAWYFNGLSIDTGQMRRLIIAYIAPVYGVFALALSGALSAPVESFLTGEANIAASGGYGPNQVSAILGLGALLALLYLVVLKAGPTTRLFLFLTLAAFLAQAALTLSRGGIYLFGLGALAALFFIFREPRLRVTILFVAALFFFTVYFFAPLLDQFTAGGLTARFGELTTTGRIELMQEEFRVWLKNPIFGAGPGMASSYRMLGDMQINVASHNEFTRMLAEHGVFGLAAIVLLISMAAHNFRQAASRAQQGMVAAFVVWTFAGMAYMALRLAAPALLFGLSGAALCEDLKEESLAAAEENEAAAVPGLNLPKPSFPRRLSR